MAEAARLRTSCPSCGARYRIDAARLKGSQANLKCSSCGTVFRVRVGQPTREASAPWLVIRADSGEEMAAPSLDTVRRLIIEGKVHGDDRIRKPGGNEQRIGDIEELQPFLRVSERSGAFASLPDNNFDADAEPEEPGHPPDATRGDDEDDDARPAEEAVTDDDESAAADDDDEDAGGSEAEDDVAAEEGVVASPVAGVKVATMVKAMTGETALADDDTPIKLEGNLASRIALGVLVVVVLAALGLGVLYLAAPNTFYSVFPFLE